MNKEELEREAKDYAEKHKMDMIDYHDSLFMEDAYLASAEPREMRIVDLTKTCEQRREHLTRAKEIIIRLLEALIVIDGEETRELKEVKEAEQFIEEIAEEVRP